MSSPQTFPDIDKDDPVEFLTLKDGRTLGYARYGAPLESNAISIPLFYFNGTPGCHIEANLITQAAAKLGVPIVSTDRPGFGYSTWKDNFALLDWPKDVLELADYLKIEKFGILGLSGGGPYALACLHAMPKDRLAGVVMVSAMYHLSLGTSGMMFQTRFMAFLATWSTWLLEKVFDMLLGSTIRTSSQEELVKQMEKMIEAQPLPAPDKAVMKQVMGDETLSKAYLGSMKGALRESSRGCAWEFWLFASETGFKMEELDGSRVVMWHGLEDINVPISMPNKAIEMLQGAEYHKVEGEAHVSLIVKHREEILSRFIQRFGSG